MPQFLSFRQPIDRLSLGLIFCLAVLITLLVGNGDHTTPRVRDFSWQNRQVGAEDTAFVLTFSRPMDQPSVESNLKIEPPLPGKFSWAGRRMAYTPLSPVPYGLEYKLRLEGARDQNAALDYYGGDKTKGVIDPFVGSFSSRDRAFAYIGVKGEETGRLIVFNLNQNKKTILTTPDLVVTEFKPYPNADKILFSAIPQNQPNQNQQKGISQQLYTVTTGIYFPDPQSPPKTPPPSGKVELVLDNQDYNLLKFDLSADGKTIIAQRINRKIPTDLGLWMISQAIEDPSRPRSTPAIQRLDKSATGEFMITPDSASIAFLQGQGVVVSPLAGGAQSWEFLPKFGRIMGFSKDGTGAAMVKFNTDYTKALFHVTNQGKEQQLTSIKGSIVNCEYNPTGTTLYCLLTELVEGEKYEEKPYLAMIDIRSAQGRPLLIFPDQRNMQMSLSPDGEVLLFDSLATAPPKKDTALRTKDGQQITNGRLWALPLSKLRVNQPDLLPQPEQLPLEGYHPVWLP